MAYSLDLSGRVALVTGASGGLGAQFAKTLSRAGAAVVLASRRMDKLKDHTLFHPVTLGHRCKQSEFKLEDCQALA